MPGTCSAAATKPRRSRSWHIAGAGQHNIRLAAFIVCCELPCGCAARAMLERLVHVQPLKLRLLAASDDIHIVAAAQAMVKDAQEAIGIRWIVHADHFTLRSNALTTYPVAWWLKPL